MADSGLSANDEFVGSNSVVVQERQIFLSPNHEHVEINASPHLLFPREARRTLQLFFFGKT